MIRLSINLCFPYISEWLVGLKNNRRCTQGKFTVNPKQYFQFYDRVIDRGLIIFVNRHTGESKAILKYVDVWMLILRLISDWRVTHLFV